ncbi:MAG: hypothetical protein KKD97_16325 [Gammaproteobacteria bacterium]|nr:hypothetical protein [Gammaproteobacteria bacterium]
MAQTLTPQDLQGMVTHHLGCPPNGYLGSDYGSDVKSMLMQPMSSPAADDLIAKMRMDIPILSVAPAGTVSVSAVDADFDRKVIRIDVLGQSIDVEAL